MIPIIFATVGTDVHPFDRMVDWVDEWAETNTHAEAVIQYGRSRPPRVAHGISYLDHEALQDWMTRAAVVISHGGPATIMEIRGSHGLPIVLPRNPTLGEHIDRHQMEFCDMLNSRGDILLCRSLRHLGELISEALEAPPRPFGRNGQVPAGVVRFSELVDDLLGSPRTRAS